MLEGNCQVAQHCFPIRFGHMRHVATLDRLHKALGHAVALRAAYGVVTGYLSSKQACLCCGVRRAVVTQPLHWRGGQLIAKALLYAFQHQVANIIAAVAGRARDTPDGFAIKAIQGKVHAQFGAVLATELQSRLSTNVYRWFPTQ